MTHTFNETHEARLAADPGYVEAYIVELETSLAASDVALKHARVGLAMWNMSTAEIDELVGPISDEDLAAVRRARGS